MLTDQQLCILAAQALSHGLVLHLGIMMDRRHDTVVNKCDASDAAAAQ